jgi:hypothetical protein
MIRAGVKAFLPKVLIITIAIKIVGMIASYDIPGNRSARKIGYQKKNKRIVGYYPDMASILKQN